MTLLLLEVFFRAQVGELQSKYYNEPINIELKPKKICMKYLSYGIYKFFFSKAFEDEI